MCLPSLVGSVLGVVHRCSQVYNEAARGILAPLGVEPLDVVAMTRLRPSLDWKDWREGKHLDCLHGNAAVHEWNTMLVNALAADLCS